MQEQHGSHLQTVSRRSPDQSPAPRSDSWSRGPCLLRSVGLKYEKAKEWKIPCVNAQWLCDILLGNFDALRQIQHSRYSVFTHPEPLAPNPQLVHNLLGRYRQVAKLGFSMARLQSASSSHTGTVSQLRLCILGRLQLKAS